MSPEQRVSVILPNQRTAMQRISRVGAMVNEKSVWAALVSLITAYLLYIIYKMFSSIYKKLRSNGLEKENYI